MGSRRYVKLKLHFSLSLFFKIHVKRAYVPENNMNVHTRGHRTIDHLGVTFHGQGIEDVISNPHNHSAENYCYPNFPDGETEAPWGTVALLSSPRWVSDGLGLVCPRPGHNTPRPLWEET